MKIIDISVNTSDKLPMWPGSTGFKLKHISKIGRGSPVNETCLEMNSHIGTHIDAPLHFIKNDKSIEKLPLEPFIGSVIVVELSRIKQVGIEDLRKIDFPKGIKRIIFKTSNSKLWKSKKFRKDYVGLTIEGARYLVKKGIRLVGVDYLSIAKYTEAVEVHRILLGKNVFILEGLNLTGVKPGKYELVCLPVKISGSEAAPARAILIQ